MTQIGERFDFSNSHFRYWQAYLLRAKDPGRSGQLLESAAALSPYLVFPFREESVPVFQWAVREKPGDWKAKYYLGLVYWGLLRPDDARRSLEACGDRPDYAPVYISRAYLNRDTNPARALADYERAHAVGKSDWRNWYHLATYYGTRGMHDKALALAREAATLFPKDDLIRILLARTYLNSGRYQECYAQLENATILPFEGQRDVHLLFVQCQLALAVENMKQRQWDRRRSGLKALASTPNGSAPGSRTTRTTSCTMLSRCSATPAPATQPRPIRTGRASPPSAAPQRTVPSSTSGAARRSNPNHRSLRCAI